MVPFVMLEHPQRSQAVVADHPRHHRAIQRWMADQTRAGKLAGGTAFSTATTDLVTVRRTTSGATVVIDGPATGDDETLGGFVSSTRPILSKPSATIALRSMRLIIARTDT